MALIRSAIAALAFGVGVLACAAPALAASANGVVVVDYSRLFKESTAGKYAQDQLKTIDSAMQAELAPQAQSLTTDQDALSPRLRGKSNAEVAEALKGDKALQQKYGAYVQKMQAFEAQRDLRSREMQATAQKAMNDLLSRAQPAIEAAMRAKNAVVALDLESTAAHNPDADVTADVINRLNQTVQSVPVARVDLTKRQP